MVNKELKVEKRIIRKLERFNTKKNTGFTKTNANKFSRRNKQLANTLDRAISPPKNNESIHIITKEQFNAFTFIPFIEKTEKIKQLYLSTYSISKKTIGLLSDMLSNNKVDLIYLVISTFITNSKKESADCLENTAKKHSNFKYISRHNHSKVILIQTENNYYVIEGSGNLTMNGRIEQYVFTCSKELYEFHKEWMLTA